MSDDILPSSNDPLIENPIYTAPDDDIDETDILSDPVEPVIKKKPRRKDKMVKTSKGKKQLASLLPSNNVEKVTRRSRLSDDAVVVNDIDVNADRPYLNEVLNEISGNEANITNTQNVNVERWNADMYNNGYSNKVVGEDKNIKIKNKRRFKRIFTEIAVVIAVIVVYSVGLFCFFQWRYSKTISEYVKRFTHEHVEELVDSGKRVEPVIKKEDIFKTIGGEDTVEKKAEKTPKKVFLGGSRLRDEHGRFIKSK